MPVVPPLKGRCIGEELVHCKRWYNDGNVAFVLLQGRRLFEFTGRSITNRF